MNMQLVATHYMALTFPDQHSQALESITPMLTDMVHIQPILDQVNIVFHDEDRIGKMIAFAACVYDLYSPASYIPDLCVKLPKGLRDEAARVAGFISPEMVNYYFKISQSYMKTTTARSSVTPFRAKVNVVKEVFKVSSVQGNDLEG